MDSETLIHIRPKTDFEKLVWERHANKLLSEEKKQLEIKMGILQSEMDELKYKHELELKELKNKFKKSEKSHLITENEGLKNKNNKNKELIKKYIIRIHELKNLNQELYVKLGRLQLVNHEVN